MGRNRFPAPDVERLPLLDGDWIEVKKELNNGDQKRVEAAGMNNPTFSNGRVINPVDWKVYEMERDLVWLVDWSLTGPDDKPIRVSLAALKAMDVESFDEIDAAILAWASKVAEAKKLLAAERAKARTDLPSTPTPPSEPGQGDAPTSL